MQVFIQQQLHGYRSGHQLLRSSVRLERKDQELIDRLSDMAGALSPGERFDPYLSAYPLPSLNYYVLARTEQDLDAPRAGCVTTKTLLVPMSYWETNAAPAELAEMLEGPTDDEPIEVPAKQQIITLPPVDGPGLTELVEALFLEKRNAIVMFEAPSPEVIALRLLSAFWPAMRRNFSLCTFALSPRSISGKSFDLLFAPKSARSRFSDWDGRRLEISGKASIPRHRWTSQVARRLFQSHTPHLLDADSIGALAADETGSRSALRLTLLWDELRDKAIESPTAVLGMIDIASSQGALTKTWDILEPTIANAIANAVESLDIQSAWAFVAALRGKLERERLSGSLGKVLRTAGAKLTERDWRSALAFLVGDDANELRVCDVSRSITSTLGGIAAPELLEALVSVPPGRLLQVVSLDDQLLARTLSSSDGVVSAALVQNLIDAFQSVRPEQRIGYWQGFLPCIRGDRHSELLSHIIAGASPAQLVDAVNVVWGVNGMRTDQIGKILCDTARASDARFSVREAFARLGNDYLTNRCIDRLLSPDESDMQWVLESPDIDHRRGMLLAGFIKRASAEDLVKAFPVATITVEGLSVLAKDLTQFASSAARLVVLPTLSVTERVHWGLKLYLLLQGSERVTLAYAMLGWIVADKDVSKDGLLEQVINAVADDVDPSSTIKIGMAPGLDGQKASRTLIAFERAAPKVRERLATYADLIVDLIVSRRTFDLTNEGATARGHFLESAVRADQTGSVRACVAILPFAMAARQKPASPLIIAAFPVVHDELLKNSDGFDMVKALLFVDWDKCKSARRDLVRAFMHSSWPPADLAITAWHTRELNRIFRRVLKERGGSRYLGEVEEGVTRLDDAIRAPVLKAIYAARNADSHILDGET